MKRFTVRYERDETKVWVAQVKELPGVITQGRSLKEARRHLRDALGLWLNDYKAADAAELVEDIRLPVMAKQVVKAARLERKRAEELQARAARSLQVAVKRLEQAGLSLQDAGELLGLTRQRVHQLAR